MARPKTHKCATCGYGICAACHFHRMPKGAAPNLVNALAEKRHGYEVVAWCKCTGTA